MIIWRTHPRWPDTEVSNEGQVRNAITKVLRKPHTSAWGTQTVSVAGTKRTVARLVYETFNGLAPDRVQVGQVDRNKSNLRPGNLYLKR
jgi:chitodextrinase